MSGNIRKDANKKKLQEELDGLMQGFEETFAAKSGNLDASSMIGRKLDDIAKPAKVYDIDFDEMDRKFKIKAAQMVNSMFDFYLDAGIIDNIEYTKRKRDLDTSNLANMLWQLKTVKTTITILMDEITSGNTNQKTISALSDMQSRFSEIMKMQANYVLFLEDTYKKMKYETNEHILDADRNTNIELKEADTHRQIAASSEFYLTASPKELIKQITEVNPLSEDEVSNLRIEEGDEESVGTKNTDPRLKEDLMLERNIQFEKKDDSGDDYDSILEMI